MHAKAMPVVLTTKEDYEAWLTAPFDKALKLQRPLPAGVLRIVATGEKKGKEIPVWWRATMDDDLTNMNQTALIAEVKRLRNGIQSHQTPLPRLVGV